jgi:hypothetical protein
MGREEQEGSPVVKLDGKPQRRPGRRLLLLLALAGVVLVLCVAGAVMITWSFRDHFTQKTVRGAANALPLIENNAYLQSPWKKFEVDLKKAVILDAVVAPEGLMQAGPYFYIKCRYSEAEIAALQAKWKAISHTAGTWRLGDVGITCSGVRYEFHQAVLDGDSSCAVIDQSDARVVHYYAYAGDG